MVNPYIAILMERYRQEKYQKEKEKTEADKIYEACLNRCDLMGGHSFWDKERLYECIDNCKRVYKRNTNNKLAGLT